MFTQKMKTILGLWKLNPIIWLATSPPFQTVDKMDKKSEFVQKSKKSLFVQLDSMRYIWIRPMPPCESNWTRTKLFKPYQCKKTSDGP